MLRRAVVLFCAFLLALPLAAQDQPPPPADNPPPAEQPPSFVIRKGRVERGDMVTVFYHVGHNRGQLLLPFLQKFVTPGVGTIEVSEPLHLMSITDRKDNIALVESVLASLDVPDDQVLIEASIIEKTIDSDFQIGTEFSFVRDSNFLKDYVQFFDPNDFLSSVSARPPLDTRFQGSTFHFRASGSGGTMDLRLRALLQRGQARILSKPTILVKTGSDARIVRGQKVPIPTVAFVNNQFNVNVTYQDVNIELTVSPHIIGQEYVELDILPKVGAVIGQEDIQGVLVPIISNREAKTDVVVRGDGEPVYIGGLVREEEIMEVRGIPILMDAPLLKYLFSKEEKALKKTEIVFILKPYIVRQTGAYNPRLIEPGK